MIKSDLEECPFCERPHPQGPCPDDGPPTEKQERLHSPYESQGYVMVEVNRMRINAAVSIVIAAMNAGKSGIQVSMGCFDAADKFLINEFKVED